MSEGTWDRLEEVFEQTRILPEAARAGFLDRACAGDAGLRSEIEAMLTACATEHSLSVERFVVEDHLSTGEGEAWLGQGLGPWRLTRVLGEGGMGLVYCAERVDGQYQLEVAVKLMRACRRSAYALERFRTERQVLASLKHPNIASLLDGGVAKDGTPYIVMELVEGVPITDWCRTRQLPLEARLSLFRVACEAVQHAHRALVVHRDLKPTNILVSDAGDVKLLDFGLAKLLEPAAWGRGTTETRTEWRALTPEYAAPEQWRGGAITTATDVYALGVLLYELVTGLRPAGPGLPPEARTRADQPTTAMPPSEAILRSARDGGGSADVRVREAGAVLDRRRLARRIRGDLDHIVLMALREEPDRRYASAGQLGEEVGRFLEGRAVLAQADTLGYRVRRFVGRNRLAVLAAAVLVVSLATFGGVSARQARILAEQRRVAQVERDTSEQVVRVLIDLFQTTNPSLRPDGDRMPLGEFLQGAQARSLDLLRETPMVRAKLQHVFGLIHQTRGQYQPARQVLEEALEQGRRLAGADHPQTLESLQALAEVCHYGGDDERARTLLDESLERHLRLYGDRHPQTARVLHALGEVVANHESGRGGELMRSALEIRRATLGVGHPDVARSLAALGDYYFARGEYEQSRDAFRQALDAFPTPQDRRNPLAITVLGDLGSVLRELKADGEAEALQREALDLARQVLGPRSIAAANLLNSIATTQAHVGRHRQAEQSFRASYDEHRELVGEGHWRTRNVARNVGRALALQGRYAEALPWMDRAIPARGPDQATDSHPWGMVAQRAQILFRLGRRAEGLGEAKTAVASLETLRDTRRAPPLAAARVVWGRLLAESGRPRDAEPPLQAALDWFDRLGVDNPDRAEASCELARARLVQGNSPEEWQRLRQCLPIYRGWGLADREVVLALDRLRPPS